MIITNHTLKDYIIYINRIFDQFIKYNIIIKNSKYFINYLLAIILNQRVNVYSFSITKNRFAILSKIVFPKNAQNLKYFLDITGYFKHYYKDYANIIKPLQKRKTQLLKGTLYKCKVKLNFTIKSNFE